MVAACSHSPAGRARVECPQEDVGWVLEHMTMLIAWTKEALASTAVIGKPTGKATSELMSESTTKMK